MCVSLILLLVSTAIFIGGSIAYLVYVAKHGLDDINSYDDSPIEL